MHLTISHRGQHHQLEFDDAATLGELQSRIADATSVPSSNQKLLPGKVAGKPASRLDLTQSEVLLSDCGLHDGQRILFVGVTGAEVAQVSRAELTAHSRLTPRKLHDSLLRSNKPRNTATANVSPFGNIHAHPNFPASTPDATAAAEAYLRRLATDPGVLHVMHLHDYHVGVLTELLPHEHPNLLGLNENMGQRISLRIRTDNYSGLRDYATSRRVLMHELAHNDVNDHPPEFKELNSQLNNQLAAFERAQREGSKRLHSDQVYQPEFPSGRAGLFGVSREEEEREERRLRVLRATEDRLANLEHEIEIGCGSTSRDKPKSVP